jgi:hypothetical protein
MYHGAEHESFHRFRVTGAFFFFGVVSILLVVF